MIRLTGVNELAPGRNTNAGALALILDSPILALAVGLGLKGGISARVKPRKGATTGVGAGITTGAGTFFLPKMAAKSSGSCPLS